MVVSSLHCKLRRVREDYQIVDNCIVNDTLCGIALTQVEIALRLSMAMRPKCDRVGGLASIIQKRKASDNL